MATAVRLSELGRLPRARAVRILEGVLAALAASGAVHGSLRPDRVLVREDEVEVTGWGEPALPPAPPVPESGRIRLGSVLYASPELVRTGEADARGDVYAVGVIAFELLSGSPPFSGDLLAVCRGHLEQEPARLDGPLADWVAALLVKDPEFRPTPAQALAQLRRFSERRGGAS